MDIVWFNEVSNLDVGLICQSSGRRQRAEEQTIPYEVPLRNDIPIEHTGKYKPYVRTMRFAWKDKEKTDMAMAWLKSFGILRVSRDPGGFFKTNILTGLDVMRQTVNYDSFAVDFLINPGFFYLEIGNQKIESAIPLGINNPGTIYSEPKIKITGTGNIDLDINGEIVVLKNLTDYIIIDTEIEKAYRDTENIGHKMEGEYPVLLPGINNISYNGNLTKIEIWGRWRNL